MIFLVNGQHRPLYHFSEEMPSGNTYPMRTHVQVGVAHGQLYDFRVQNSVKSESKGNTPLPE